MTQKKEIYKCFVCGNIVEVLHNGAGELVCCGQPMRLMSPETQDGDQEKHVPVIQENEIIVGEKKHPMEKEHYIEWIEAESDQESSKKFLEPGEEPVYKPNFQVKKAQAYCNIHGLWATR